MGEERQGRERQGGSTRNDKSHSAEAVAVLRQYSHKLACLGAWFASSSMNIPQTSGNLKGNNKDVWIYPNCVQRC